MAITDWPNFSHAYIHPTAGFRNTSHTANDMRPTFIVLEYHIQCFTYFLSLFLRRLYISRIFKFFRNCHFKGRIRDGHRRFTDGARVFNADYEITDSIAYHELFFIPGMFPSSASSRKQIRQRLKSRIKPRGRPHLKQRRTVRLENFGLRFAFAIIDFLAIRIVRSSKTLVRRKPQREFEAPASASCECRLWTASPVTLF